MTIRHALASDLPTIVAIYNASIPGRMATADTAPVTVEEREPWFREFDPARRPLWVWSRTDRAGPEAWLSLRSFYGRPAYRRTVEVAIYTAPDVRRRGLARALLAHAIGQAPALGIKTLLAFVFGHNAPSLALFGAAGFARWGHLPEVAELDYLLRDLVILGRHSTRHRREVFVARDYHFPWACWPRSRPILHPGFLGGNCCSELGTKGVHMRKTMLLLVPLVLGGCQSWGPTWSEVSGSRYNRIDMNRSETIIQEVDGKTAIPEQGRYRVVRADPGKRVVTLRAVPLQPAEILNPGSERFTLDVEPCKRYYLNAQFDGPTAKSWKPVVDYVEPVAGCQVTAMSK